MRKIAIIAGCCVALAACKSEAEKKAEFIAFCTSNDFTAKQCEVLYFIAKSSADAQDSAAAASMASGMAAGMAVGMSSGRR